MSMDDYFEGKGRFLDNEARERRMKEPLSEENLDALLAAAEEGLADGLMPSGSIERRLRALGRADPELVIRLVKGHRKQLAEARGTD